MVAIGSGAPPSPLASLLGVPVVVREDLGPGVWWVLDRDGAVIAKGVLCDVGWLHGYA